VVDIGAAWQDFAWLFEFHDGAAQRARTGQEKRSVKKEFSIFQDCLDGKMDVPRCGMGGQGGAAPEYGKPSKTAWVLAEAGNECRLFQHHGDPFFIDRYFAGGA
jgi:hypothetical protein